VNAAVVTAIQALQETRKPREREAFFKE
jgi:hypothetical protein